MQSQRAMVLYHMRQEFRYDAQRSVDIPVMPKGVEHSRSPMLIVDDQTLRCVLTE